MKEAYQRKGLKNLIYGKLEEPQLEIKKSASHFFESKQKCMLKEKIRSNSFISENKYKAEPGNCIPLFIACSSHLDNETIRNAKDIGFDLVLEAPLNIQKIQIIFKQLEAKAVKKEIIHSH